MDTGGEVKTYEVAPKKGKPVSRQGAKYAKVAKQREE
jgi:hypothetical protein